MANQLERKEEAVKRLQFLKKKGMKFGKEPIEAFKRGSVGIFENQSRIFRSTYYDLYMNKSQEDYQEIIKAKEEFESKRNCTVYLIQISHTDFGKCVSMFYVSDTEEEWGMDNSDLNEGYTYAYVYNQTYPDYSEIGSIGFAYDNMCGGIYRTA